MSGLGRRLALALLFGAAACGSSGGERSVLLSWQLGDERTCLDSGIGYVDLRSNTDDRDFGYFYCEDGFVPRQLQFATLRERGEDLELSATSWAGAVLYRGHLRSPLPDVATVTLFAVDAE